MMIEIKNITVGSLFDQVCAGPRWSALKVFYNLNVPGYMNIKKKMLKILLCDVFNPNGTGVFLGQSEPGGGLISTPPPSYLCPGASGRLVLNMTIVGYPLKIFLRYITFL